MKKVLAFPTQEKEDPHLSGEALCVKCKHKWIAVAPVGAVELECPECGMLSGLFRYFTQTKHEQWVCNCGGFFFAIDTEGAYCIVCGTRQSW